jgi:hypothetical protein
VSLRQSASVSGASPTLASLIGGSGYIIVTLLESDAMHRVTLPGNVLDTVPPGRTDTAPQRAVPEPRVLFAPKS